ncbi:MAG: c-type cytochrome, partial [Acidobacteriota bacterium]
MGVDHSRACILVAQQLLNAPAVAALLFPKIDRAKAAKGAKLYRQSCASCHQVIDRKQAIATGYKAVNPLLPG